MNTELRYKKGDMVRLAPWAAQDMPDHRGKHFIIIDVLEEYYACEWKGNVYMFYDIDLIKIN